MLAAVFLVKLAIVKASVYVLKLIYIVDRAKGRDSLL